MPTPDQIALMISSIEAAGLSRTEIATEAGLSRGTIWRAAEGEMRAPSFDTVTRIIHVAERVGVSPRLAPRR